MTITALTDPNTLPHQLQEQLVFDDNMARMIADLPLRAQQENALAANLNAIAAGGAYAIPYVLDTTTTADGDPGNGKMRLNSYATQWASSYLYVDALDAAGTNVIDVLNTMDDSLSAVKGTIKLVKAGDASRWAVFNVIGMTSPAGYRGISVTPVQASHTNPFANGDMVLLQFQRTGDRGLQGANGRDYLLATVDIASTGALAMIEYQSLFTNDYDSYTIECTGVMPSGAAGVTDVLYVRLWTGGALLTSASYTLRAHAWQADVWVNAVGGADSQYNVTNSYGIGSVGTQAQQPGYARGFTGSIKIMNARSTTNPTRVLMTKGVHGGGSSLYSDDYQSIVNVATAVDGFRLYFAAQTISAGIVRLIGHRNT